MVASRRSTQGAGLVALPGAATAVGDDVGGGSARGGSGGDDGLLWGVGAVATRLGLPPATLRTWERRYGVGPSRRTSGGHRRYDEEDILRTQVVAHLIARGVPPQAAARVVLSLDHGGLLAALGEQDSLPVAPVEEDLRPEVAVQQIVAAADQGAPDALCGLYGRVLAQWGIVPGWDVVLSVALARIGELWSAGLMGIEGEHLASEELAAELRSFTRRTRPPSAVADAVLLASADDDLHSLPLLALEAALAERGFSAHGLGARVPACALEHTITRRRPRVVFLWASIARPAQDATWELLERLDPGVRVLVGGPGWPAERVGRLEYGAVSLVTSLEAAVDAVCEGLER